MRAKTPAARIGFCHRAVSVKSRGRVGARWLDTPASYPDGNLPRVSLATETISVIIAGGAFVVAALGLRRSGRANDLAEQALAWQRQRDKQREQTRMRVEFGHRLTRFPSPAEGVLFARADLPLDYVLTLEILNEHPERSEYVASAWIEIEGADRGIDLLDDTDPARADREVKPRSRLPLPLVVYEQSDDLARGFRGVVRLADGQSVRSEVEHLIDDLVDDMRRHNSRGRLDEPPAQDTERGS